MFNQVVLIDDSEADLLFGRIILERSGAAREVLAFESATQALAFLVRPEAAAVDLVLLDINMPGMNGFEFLEAWRDSEGGCRPVVVMLTSSPDPGDRARAATFPCVRGYLTKPLDRDGAARLAGMLGLPPAP